jgi:outer membrane protein OmpA-like peptidoglycan-associated protein
MFAQALKSVNLVLVLAFAVSMPIALAAQDSAKPAAKASADDSPSRWDIFAGYSYLSPHGTISPDNGAVIHYHGLNYGVIGSVAYYFNRYVGVQGEGDVHALSESQPANGDFSGGSAGLIFRYPYGHVTPFGHALVGGEYAGGYLQQDVWGPVLTVGGGLDYATPWFDHHLSIRLFQADYQYTHLDFGVDGGSNNFNLARLSAGLVFGLGSIVPPPPVALACTASPVSIYPGDPVTVTATAAELDPKMNAIYSWSGTAVTGSGTTVSVSTGSLAPGTYTVKGEVKEGKPGKEGMKPGEDATCSALFTVKAFEPPTVSCTASPTSLHPGDPSTVTAMGVSPQNRPLTYTYSASAGTISGSGTTASYSSAGAPTGSVGITCNVADDKGGTATNGTTVEIVAPPPPPQPHASALCSISFDKDMHRPTRVDNEAKACLDQVTSALKNDPTATVVVVGESTAAEKAPPKHKHAMTPADFAAQRAVNTKDYLVTANGIDASRIIVHTGTADSQSVEDYLVPAGANFDSDVPGTTAVDPSGFKAASRQPIGAPEPMKMHKKKTAEAKPPAGQ